VAFHQWAWVKDGQSRLSACVDQTLRGETALTRPVARALLDHFERNHAQLRGRNAMVVGEESPLGLEAPQRELLMRLAVVTSSNSWRTARRWRRVCLGSACAPSCASCNGTHVPVR
jgi:hypothetical protein